MNVRQNSLSFLSRLLGPRGYAVFKSIPLSFLRWARWLVGGTGSISRRVLKSLLFALFNRNEGSLFIQYRPDYHYRHGRFENFSRRYAMWTGADQDPNAGDHVRFYLINLLVASALRNCPEGSLAEVGVYKGASSALIASLAPDRPFYLFDTFSGFPEQDLEAEKEETGLDYASKHFSGTSLEKVRAFIGHNKKIVFCPGYFPETTDKISPDERFCFVHFDADLYKSAKAFNEFFYPKMLPGGVMLFHDYNGGFAGVKKAVDEYFSDKPEGIVEIPDKSGSAVVIKSK